MIRAISKNSLIPQINHNSKIKQIYKENKNRSGVYNFRFSDIT